MKDDDESAKQAYDHGAGSSEVRVVSFDLDNTVWKTGPTIQAANDVLASFLEKQGIEEQNNRRDGKQRGKPVRDTTRHAENEQRQDETRRDDTRRDANASKHN